LFHIGYGRTPEPLWTRPAAVQSPRRVVRDGLHQAASRLLHILLRGGLIGSGRRDRGCAGPRRRQCLIVNLLGHFPFVDQQLVAAEILLRPDIVGLSLFQLGVSGKELLSAAETPAVAFSMSDEVDVSWLTVLIEVIGTVIFSDCAVASALAKLAFACATATS